MILKQIDMYMRNCILRIENQMPTIFYHIEFKLDIFTN